MKRSLRSAAKRAGSPLLGPLDRRLTELGDAQRKELERIDERLEIDLRILDEHLLAIRRATRGVEPDPLAAAVHEALGHGVAADGGLVIIAPPGTPVVVPEGFEVDRCTALVRGDDGTWVGHDADDSLDALRVVRLRRR